MEFLGLYKTKLLSNNIQKVGGPAQTFAARVWKFARRKRWQWYRYCPKRACVGTEVPKYRWEIRSYICWEIRSYICCCARTADPVRMEDFVIVTDFEGGENIEVDVEDDGTLTMTSIQSIQEGCHWAEIQKSCHWQLERSKGWRELPISP